jgi:hypothetical protein
LTWEASADDIDSFERVRVDLSDISENASLRKPFPKYVLSVFVPLDRPRDLKAGSLESEIESAYTSKERSDLHHREPPSFARFA